MSSRITCTFQVVCNLCVECNDGFFEPSSFSAEVLSTDHLPDTHRHTGGPSNYALVYGALRETFSSFTDTSRQCSLRFFSLYRVQYHELFLLCFPGTLQCAQPPSKPKVQHLPHPGEKRTPSSSSFSLTIAPKVRCGRWTGIRCR